MQSSDKGVVTIQYFDKDYFVTGRVYQVLEGDEFVPMILAERKDDSLFFQEEKRTGHTITLMDYLHNPGMIKAPVTKL
jgi:hypothetical protein